MTFMIISDVPKQSYEQHHLDKCDPWCPMGGGLSATEGEEPV